MAVDRKKILRVIARIVMFVLVVAYVWWNT